MGQASGPLPLGIEARSHAGQRPIGRQRQSGGPIPPSSQPSPPGEGALSVVVRDVWLLRFVAPRPIVLPLLWGAGRGEGERGRRTDAAAQNVAGTRETEPQSLAALDSPSPDISQAARNADRPERRLSAGLSRSTATRGANRPPPFSLAALSRLQAGAPTRDQIGTGGARIEMCPHSPWQTARNSWRPAAKPRLAG